MSPDSHEDRLVHYLAGECTEDEKAEIEAWIQADPAHRKLVQELRRLWDATGDPPSRRSVDAMWDKLSRRMALPESKTIESSKTKANERAPLKARRHRSRRHEAWKQPVRIAVSIAFIAATAFLIGQVMNADGILKRSALREVATEAGERARVRLADGTHVILNAESKLTMPASFAGNERLVQLQGEAYFEVAPDLERPFVVHAEGTVTRVVGTKFNVGAYPDEEDVNVVVAEGKVAVRAEETEEEQALLLSPRQMVRFSKTNGSALRSEVDPSRYLAWTKGQLVFIDAPFQKVARKLEHWYGLHVKLEGSQAGVDRLNASFEEEPTTEVLSVIAEALHLRYERDGKTVTFYTAESK